MRETIEKLLLEALEALVASGALSASAVPDQVTVERARDRSHGDFASNAALIMARAAKRSPRDLAEQLVAAIPGHDALAKVEIAGPGFINFHLSDAARFGLITTVLERGDEFGRSATGAGRRVLVEFVSANPTGPLHVGHGRHAAYGDSVANLLAATGHDVSREYYVNDAGRQMDILALSVWLRYLELQGAAIEFPAAGYRGTYIREIAAELAAAAADTLARPVAEVFADVPADGERRAADQHVDALIARCRALLGPANYRRVADTALSSVLADIRDDLAEFGVRFDNWFSERSLYDDELVTHALAALEQHGDLFEHDGAKWFRSSQYGDEKDRVVVRDNGQTTYIASDIAYHLNKRERGFDLLLDVLGADHHGYVARVRAGLEATGQPPETLDVQLVQFVSLYRGGSKEQMSTRSGQFVTLRQLREEVGNDAARLFYVMRSNDQHLNFDLDLARSRSEDNPVYYIQYAHARICNVFAKLAEQGLAFDAANADLGRLDTEHESQLLAELGRYPDVVELAASNRAPHHLVHYLRELAHGLHTYYNASRFIVDDAPLRDARLALITAVRQVLANGLTLLGVAAPESM